MQFSPNSMARAGENAGLILQRQTTESIPRIVEASLGQYFRYKWMIPRRITNALGINRLCSTGLLKEWIRVNGEAI